MYFPEILFFFQRGPARSFPANRRNDAHEHARRDAVGECGWDFLNIKKENKLRFLIKNLFLKNFNILC